MAVCLQQETRNVSRRLCFPSLTSSTSHSLATDISDSDILRWWVIYVDHTWKSKKETKHSCWLPQSVLYFLRGYNDLWITFSSASCRCFACTYWKCHSTLAIDGAFVRKCTRTILYKCTKPFCLLLWLLNYCGNLKRFIMPPIYYSSQLINWKLVYLYQLGFNTWQWGLWKYSGIFDYLKAGVHYIFQLKKYLLLPV